MKTKPTFKLRRNKKGWGIYHGRKVLRQFEHQSSARLVFSLIKAAALPVTVNSPEYELCEAVADVAYHAGLCNYYGGDSREDIADYISVAKMFLALHKGNDWRMGDYIELIADFAALFFDRELTEHERVNPDTEEIPLVYSHNKRCKSEAAP